jgi:hypothetical protein
MIGRILKPGKLNLVQTDLWGPSIVTSLGGSRYYITFIDESSRQVWVVQPWRFFKRGRAVGEIAATFFFFFINT